MTKVMAITSVIKLCYGLNVCVTPKIHMLDSNVQYGGILKWGPWGVIRLLRFLPL